MKTKISTMLLIAATTALFYSCDNKTADAEKMAELDARKEAITKVYSMFETGNTDGVEMYVNDNVIEHAVMPGITEKGIAGLKQAVAMNYEAFPNSKMTIISMVNDGDLTYIHYNWKATNTGPMGEGMPATGKAVDVNGVDILRWENGKAAEHWGYSEEGKMMEQLGMGMGAPIDMPMGEEDDAPEE
jgi:predicted ester cyclase